MRIWKTANGTLPFAEAEQAASPVNRHGAWGTHHARAIQETTNAELVAIAARSEESQAAAKDGQRLVEVVTDYRKLLNRSDIDMIDSVVPTHLHHEVTCAALKAGKHVLLEKPMAANMKDCADIVSLAKQKLTQSGERLRMAYIAVLGSSKK